MANRLPQPIIVCIAVNAAGDPDITGTPLVLRYKCPIDWFPVNPPATVTDPITGVVSPYVGAVFDPKNLRLCGAIFGPTMCRRPQQGC
jgi:hypothetical protein